MAPLQPYVTLSVENNVGYIEFFHPAQNAMPANLLTQLISVIKEADASKEIKVIILKSGGDRTFCAGANFSELMAIETIEQGEAFFKGFANVINTMRNCSKIILGRIQGKAVGGGVGIAAATDYCMATKYASIKLSELTIGIGPSVIEPAVTRKIGLSAFTQMTLDAETFFSPEWAKQQGLFNAVYDSVEALDYALKTFAEKLTTYNPEALKAMKVIFWKNTADWDDLLLKRARLSGELVLSEFTKKTLKKFES